MRKKNNIADIYDKIEDPNFQLYWDTIKDIEPLTSEECRQLGKDMVNGDKTAREELIVRNLKHAADLCLPYYLAGFPIMDLVQIANEGLVKAVDCYDYTLSKNNLSTLHYIIFYHTKRALEMGIRTLVSDRNFPHAIMQKYLNIESYIREYELLNGTYPSATELAKELQIKTYQAEAVLEALKINIVGTRVIEAEAQAELMDTPEIEIDVPEILGELIDTHLNTREKQVIRMRFYEDKSLEECGKILGLSSARVRQIEIRAIYKLRKYKHTIN